VEQKRSVNDLGCCRNNYKHGIAFLLLAQYNCKHEALSALERTLSEKYTARFGKMQLLQRT